MTQLFQAILDALLVFEFTDDDQMDPDVSVSALESIAATLQEAPEELRIQFCKNAATVAASEPDPDRASFLRELPWTLGLIDDQS